MPALPTVRHPSQRAPRRLRSEPHRALPRVPGRCGETPHGPHRGGRRPTDAAEPAARRRVARRAGRRVASSSDDATPGSDGCASATRASAASSSPSRTSLRAPGRGTPAPRASRWSAPGSTASRVTGSQSCTTDASRDQGQHRPHRRLASGVFVVDAKKYKGQPGLRVEGGLVRPRTETLMVGGRDCSKLVDGVLKQVDPRPSTSPRSTPASRGPFHPPEAAPRATSDRAGRHTPSDLR